MKKILLVDDDPISLYVLTNYLKSMDYIAVTANDGLQAWEILQKNPEEFSVVIADRIMPKLHGLQLLEKMRNHVRLKTVPVILLTGEAEKEEQITAVKAGVFDFLYKPIDKQLLITVLKRALQAII